MKSYQQFLQDAWNPPFKPLPGSGKTPMQKAREKAKSNPNVNLDAVRTSAKRFAEPFDTTQNPNYTGTKGEDEKGNPTYTFKHKSQPLEVSFTAGDKPNQFYRNTRNTDPNRANYTDSQKLSVGREMMKLQRDIKARPGTTILSQPTSISREKAYTNQGLHKVSDPNQPTTLAGTARNLSPRQKANKVSPYMKPKNLSGPYVDPTHS